MSALTILLLAICSAFAAVVAIRANGDVDQALRELRSVQAKLSATEADLSTTQRRLETVQLHLAETDRRGASQPVRPPNAASADPRVYVQRVPDQPHDRVILSNRSEVTAHDLRLDLTCPGGVTPFLPEFVGSNFPVEMLQQGVPYIVLASFRGQCWPPVDARLEWRDPDGSHQVREFPLHW